MSISTKSKIVVLRVIAGDNQSGYFAHEITYSEASVAGLSVNELASVLDLRSSVLRFDEFDFNERPRNQSFVHRMLLWPEHRGELEIAFQDLNIRSLPLSIRGYINFGISFDLRD
jgi:hypothetical protein